MAKDGEGFQIVKTLGKIKPEDMNDHALKARKLSRFPDEVEEYLLLIIIRLKLQVKVQVNQESQEEKVKLILLLLREIQIIH